MKSIRERSTERSRSREWPRRAPAGEVERALTIMLDVEQPLYEATTLLNAASLLHRCAAS